MPVYAIAMLIDARGLTCPMPTARTTQALQSVQSGEIVEVLATDPGSVRDFDAWAKATGHELIETTSNGATYTFVIRHK